MIKEKYHGREFGHFEFLHGVFLECHYNVIYRYLHQLNYHYNLNHMIDYNIHLQFGNYHQFDQI